MSQAEPLLPRDLDVEDAETANMQSLEQGLHASSIDSLQYGAATDTVNRLGKLDPKKRFQQGVRKAMLAKKLWQQKKTSFDGAQRQRSNSVAHNILRHISDQGEAAEPAGKLHTHARRRSFGDVTFMPPLFDDFDSTQSEDDRDDGLSSRSDLRLTGTQYGTSSPSNTTNRPHRRPATDNTWFRLSVVVNRCFRFDLLHVLLRSTLLWIALPCAVAALILYYPLANPVIDFLPGSVTVAWWFNFIARQMVTFELARLLEYVIVDSLLLKSRWDRSQLVSFVAYHIEGWPFVMVAWATIDLFVLHGSNRFQVHWLCWTRWRIYSHEASSGAYILTSEVYLRLLLSMIFLGVATVIKRCILELQFGGRLHTTFKPKLEQILREIILVSEVAALGEEADFVEELDDVDAISVRTKADKGIGLASPRVDWSSTSDLLSDTHLADAAEGTGEARTLANGSPVSTGIEALLDRWEEPSDTDRKGSVIGVNDAVTFRRVLAHLKRKSPFGDSFGPSWNRQETIQSSQMLYSRLLKLSETPTKSLAFETLSVIAIGDDGSADDDKLEALRKVFRPDALNELPLLAFVSSIDSVYKRLRYFQASVANASKLDRVLEDTMNVIFFFVLGLAILVFMNFNPWPVLVSITSLLVSVSFALGSSLSKWVEGILLIAVRRPYDLGDRVIITSAESLENPGSTSSWYVEDINLFSTTLRYARTNEVSSINNSSIASSRIINCNRSSHAIVFLDKVTHISILDGNNLQQFQLSLENYVRDNPRIWDSLAFLRIESIDTNSEQAKFSMAFRHRNSWQDAGRILLNRADLIRFVYDILKGLDAAYDNPPTRQLIYYGGELEEGQVQDYKLNLLNATNIRKKTTASGRTSGSMDFFESLQKPLEGE